MAEAYARSSVWAIAYQILRHGKIAVTMEVYTEVPSATRPHDHSTIAAPCARHVIESSHWVHHDEHERVNQLLIDFFSPAPPAQNPAG